jgi:hypothetical protein
LPYVINKDHPDMISIDRKYLTLGLKQNKIPIINKTIRDLK